MTAMDADLAREQLLELATSDYLISRDRVIESLEALRRLDEGAYGLCVSCGETISRERLAVRPEATNCVKCQIREEHYLAA